MVNYDGPIDIAIGRSRKETSWKNREWTWKQLVEKLSTTHRTAETIEEYNAAKKPRQDEIKDVGGFVGGYLTGGRRKNGMVAHRQLLTLDLDFATPTVWDELMLTCTYACCMYSTHKHQPTSPRLRLVIPLDRPVDASEYEAIARRIAGEIGIELFDPTTFEPARLMYWPSTSSNGEYVFEFQDGPWLSADTVLSTYRDWKDISEWPFSVKVDGQVRRNMAKQGDPLEKPGIIGAFCRVYTIAEAIDKFIPEIYTPCIGQEGTSSADRYTYAHGSTAAGVVVYDDRFAYSHHGTDPMGGKLCNAFDMVRIHLFGIKDEGIAADTPTTKLPSYEDMCALATEDRAVRIQIGVEKIAEAGMEFGMDLSQKKINVSDEYADQVGSGVIEERKRLSVDHKGDLKDVPVSGRGSGGGSEDDGSYLDEDDELNELVETPTEVSSEEMEWLADLEVDKKGNYFSTVDNVLLILTNDPKLKGKLVYSSFDKREIAVGHLPWRRVTRSTKNLTDRDESGLRHYLEKVYGIQGNSKIEDGWALAVAKNTVHPVKEYLNRWGAEGVWDGVERVDTLLIRYLGAADNRYVRAVTRKTLVAAVARIFRPGIKFDNVLTLVGPQGIGKSQLIKRLGGDWYSDSFGGIGTKEAFEAIQGVWLVEIAELAGLRKAEIDSIKHFISKQEDYFRVPYAKRVENFPRQCIFFATTNDDDFLKDQTGNRRWWPVSTMVNGVERTYTELEYDETLGVDIEVEKTEVVPVGDLFKELDKETVGQIWAEVMHLWRSGEKLVFDRETERDIIRMAEAVQTQHTEVDPRIAVVREYLELPLCEEWYDLGFYEKRAWLEEVRKSPLRLTLESEPQGYDTFYGEEVPVWYLDGVDSPVGGGVKAGGKRRVFRRDKVSIHEIWTEALGCDLKSMTANNTKPLHIAMRSKTFQNEGWSQPSSGKIKLGGSSVRGYVRCEK